MPQPRSPDDEAKQIEAFKARIQGWADTLGVTVSFPEMKNATQVVIEAKTEEAKLKFIQWGIVSGVTKIVGEARWLEGRRVVVVRADLPKAARILMGVTVDPAAPQIIEAQKLLAHLLGAGEDACHLI
jgi:hypothetical protein